MQLKFGYKVWLDEIINTATISKVCGVTNYVYSVTVTLDEWERKLARKETSQAIWPDMDTNDREFLISGITPPEWEHLYG